MPFRNDPTLKPPPPYEPTAPAEPARQAVWGLDAVELHYRFWASRSVQVIRPGEGHTPTRRAELYLLLDPATLVLFQLQRAVNTLLWRRNALLFVRLHCHQVQPYRERLNVDEHGRFIAFERAYRRQRVRITRLAITTDRQIACHWHHVADAAAGWRGLRLTVPRQQRTTVSLTGQAMPRHDPDERRKFTQALIEQWGRPDATVPRAQQAGEGLWVDREAAVYETVRFIGPAWVGAGRKMADPFSVAGPAALWDAEPVSPDVPERWRWPTRPSPVLRTAARSHRPTVGRRFSKRCFDLAFASVALLAVLPLFPLIMLAIWLEDGRPFFFSHQRETLGGREFPCLKFRSMRNDAEQIKAKLAAVNQVDGPQFFMENDPRVTKVGRVLRKTHLDELPQLLNVLAGQMSVVGPRPSPHAENQYCPAWREARLSIRPGITGLWQVMRTRREGEDFQEWIRYDLEYVDRMNWSLDLWILWCTARHLLRL